MGIKGPAIRARDVFSTVQPSWGFTSPYTACKFRQLGFWNGKFRKTAIHADEKLWEYRDYGLVQTFPAGKMDDHLRAKLCPVF